MVLIDAVISVWLNIHHVYVLNKENVKNKHTYCIKELSCPSVCQQLTQSLDTK